MKIQVNQTAAKLRKEEVINEILELAKSTAEKGLNNFTYYFKDGERESFPPPFINIDIEDKSDGSVKCGYRCDCGTHVTYYIS